MVTRFVTIDGPAGCGKSTAVRALAARAGGIAFSSGLIYRVVTLLARRAGLLPELGGQPGLAARVLEKLADHELEVAEHRDPEGRLELRVLLDGEDPGDEALHRTEVTRDVHWIADDPELRQALLPLQREIDCSVVVFTEGRDTGTVVYPQAEVKLYLTASLAERARRRFRELTERGEQITLEQVLEDVEARDRHDRERKVAPLRRPQGAVEIDSTGLTIDEVLERMSQAIPPGWK